MKRLTICLMELCFVIVIGSGSAQATSINLSGLNGELTLQGIFDNMTQGGSSSVNVATDQVVGDEYWMTGSTTNSVATMIIEIAGGAGGNSFGIYDSTDPTNKAEVFSGPDTGGAQQIINIDALGNVTIFNSGGTTATASFGSTVFGFYMTASSGATYYSDPTLNVGNADNMVAFQGTGDMVDIFLNDSVTAYNPWLSNEYILAWEDTSYTSWDWDYNDMALMVESITPVPEPITLILLGSGFAGFAFMRRRFRDN